MGRRIAVLIGNKTFPKESGLEPLCGPVNDVGEIGEVLANPQLGNFEIREVLDKQHHEVMTAIVEVLVDRV